MLPSTAVSASTVTVTATSIYDKTVQEQQQLQLLNKLR